MRGGGVLCLIGDPIREKSGGRRLRPGSSGGGMVLEVLGMELEVELEEVLGVGFEILGMGLEVFESLVLVSD